ncbi:FAST kinase domain-containing protein 2 [Oryzias melastigma]|uniref:FAST kinase domain-containing protein 2 n=1 Tax=Oryzias melastigma TaxID=30732 RepID=A0A834F8N8_ORYME|nr:FAST kinase domain-containing protein 2 [Oryzias melastigma]
MSALMSGEVMRLTLRFCRFTLLWQQRCFLATAFCKDALFYKRQTKSSWASLDIGRTVRFYCHDGDQSRKLEKIQSSSSEEASSPSSDQRHRGAHFHGLLQRCSSPSDVLDLTCQYAPTIRQVSNCLTHMWSCAKKMSEEQRRYELRLMFQHPAFDRLLQQAMRSAPHMPHIDLAYSLLSMVSLGVPERSRVVQTLLRTCQEKLNDFDEKSLSILASSLEQMDSSPNVEALKEGMRLVVEVQLPHIKNVVALQSMMRLLGKDAPKELKLKLERKALSVADQFSLPNAQHMICTMAAMEFYSKPLLQLCSKKILNNLHGIPFNRFYQVLLSCNKLSYRDTALLTGISDYVASTVEIWSNKQLLLLLTVFEDLTFTPAALMEAYAEKVIAHPDALTLRDLLCVVKVYSYLNFDLQHRRQQFLKSISHALDSYLPRMSEVELLKSAYCLCLMGHFPPALLEQLLQRSAAERPSDSKLLRGREKMFQMVDLCLRLDRPPLPQPLSVPAPLLGDPDPSPEVNPRLSLCLRNVLGGRADATLQEMVVLENFYTIDAVITTSLLNQAPGGLAGEQSSQAEGTQRVAVIYVPYSSFCFGTSCPRGLLAVKIRHLRILGYTPVLVTEQDLQRDEEAIHLLRSQIFSETEPKDG